MLQCYVCFAWFIEYGYNSHTGNKYLVVVWKYGRHLSADETQVEFLQVVDGPCPGVQGMVDISLPWLLPLPGPERLSALTLTGQDLLVHCLPIFPDAYHKL